MPGISRRSVRAALATSAVLPLQDLAAQQPPARRQYLYVLRVAPPFQKEAAWTDAENAAVSKHFDRLAKATTAGQVILARRTGEALDKTIGLVIFEADGDAEAKAFMDADPAIVAGLMTATLHPYAVALIRK